MEIRKGYKHSDLGLIPKDWEVIELNSISKIVRGGSPRPAGDPKYFGSTYMPWLTVAALTNVSESSIFLDQALGFLTKEGVQYSRLLEKGTLILSNSGATLGVAKILDLQCCANDGIAAFLNVHKGIDKVFLCYFLNTKTKVFREVVATGNGQPNLNTTLIGRTKVAFPISKEEQSKIGQTLLDLDNLIASLNKLILKKQNIKRGAMQLLLSGKKRLPGFKTKWVKMRIGDLLSYEQPVNYIVKDTDYNESVGTPVLTANKSFILGYTYEAEGIYRNVPAIIFDDFTTASKYVDFPFKVKSSAIKILTAKKNISDLRFVFEKMQRIQFSIGDHKRYYISEYQNIILDVPGLDEQEAISQVIFDMDNEIKQYQDEVYKYRLMKNGMLQELLTGKKRLI